MVIHELATNASKYGALSDPNGVLEISWRQDESPDGSEIALRWRERDGPEAISPVRRGFGLTLVEREIRQGLGGQANIAFAASGLEVDLAFSQ
jgi:two-component system CheB/CheR fusion protein